ncbi:hypothetical protein QN277_019487 [Acacia crassicarpa]|uniref:Uncharacterized protein n=1 Tax=Acacia crassicarpa TaxID=499986 RepID=A0AAE1MK34_9FABA|nr:hypothetical protein QN277_019487 [Acacia crassicarpa]
MKTVTISKKRLLVGVVEASLHRLSRLAQALSAPLTEIARAHMCISSFPSLMLPCSDEVHWLPELITFFWVCSISISQFRLTTASWTEMLPRQLEE